MIKYIQKMKIMVGLGFIKILVPQIFIDLEGSHQNYMDFKLNTLQVQFLMSFWKIECGHY